MAEVILEITGPEDKHHPVLHCRCKLCSAYTNFRFLSREAVPQGDLVAVLKALFEHRPLPEPTSAEEIHLQELAKDIAQAWYREMTNSRRCQHCPRPTVVRRRLSAR